MPVRSVPRALPGYCAAARIGTCALRKGRTFLIMRCLSSSGSRHGKTVISAFGASEATSIEVCSGCDGVSSGSTRIGVWQFLMKSRGHAVEEIGLHAPQAVEILVDRVLRHLGAALLEIGQPIIRAVPVHDSRIFRPIADGLVEDRGDDAVGRPLQQFAGKAAADAVAHEEELPDAEMVHQPELVVGKGVPGVLGRHRAGRTRRHWRCAGPS